MDSVAAPDKSILRTDRLGNELAPSLPYARGQVLSSTEDDYRKLRHAWRMIADRIGRLGRESIHNFSGLERSFVVPADELWTADDELAPALHLDQVVALGLAHLGGDPESDDIAVFNRLTAATYAALRVLAAPGDTIVGASASYSHPSVARAAGYVGAKLVDTRGYDAFARAMETETQVSTVVLTRLAVTYEILPLDEIRRILDRAHDHGAQVYVDDAGGARVGPAIFGQPRLLELGADVGATGLDKYGTVGPRLGLLGGRRDLVDQIRARGFEMGLEARPMVYPAVRHSLEQYRPERVRALVACTQQVGRELSARLGRRITSNEVIAELAAEDAYEEAVDRSASKTTHLVPYECVAALAMLLLRDHGILTVHFAGLPPGTSSILFKFVPPEVLDTFGGAASFAKAVDTSIDQLAAIMNSPDKIDTLLFGSA